MPTSDATPLGRRRKLALALVMGVFTYTLIESSALVALSYLSGGMVSPLGVADERAAVLLSGDSGEALAVRASTRTQRFQRLFSQRQVVHPYLGYVDGPDPEPRPRTDGQVLIGIFGGSAAARFAASTELVDALARELRIAPDVLTTVNLAVGGFKQPQQLMALNYWLVRGGELDVAVNIDGFNEVALHRTENGATNVAAVYPRQWYARMQDLPDPVLRRLVGKVTFLEDERRKLARGFSSGSLSWSPLWNLTWKVRDGLLLSDIARAQEQFQQHAPMEAGRLVAGPVKPYARDREMYQDLVDIWERSALQMHRICEANEIRYFHFVQPNQYIPGAKPLSRMEQRVAYQENYRLRADVEQGYPMLLRAAEGLRRRGISVFDLTKVFADVEDTLYVDRCCHFNDKGNALMAAAVARALAGDRSVRRLAGSAERATVAAVGRRLP